MSEAQQFDTIEKLGKSLIQHGPLSRRVYLMKLHPEDADGIVHRMLELAEQNEYTKLFGPVPESVYDHFAPHGFEIEARVPGYYRDAEDALYISNFLDPARRIDDCADRCEEVIEAARARAAEPPAELPRDHSMRTCTPEDIVSMVELYETVFETYPFPIHDADFIRETMDNEVLYAGIWHADRLVALCSADVDRNTCTAEMTDFATHPETRGKGFAGILLQCAEQAAAEHGVRTPFTIARAKSFGMNIVFARAGYTFTGRLVQNTNISGQLESMNIWYKKIKPAS